MNLLSYLKDIPGLLKDLFNAIKLFLAGLYIRRSTQIEVKKNALEQENKIKDQQLEIASHPAANPSDARDSMRNNKL